MSSLSSSPDPAPAPSAINDQILQSVALAQSFTIASAPAQTIAALDVATSHSLGLAMFNAIAAQQRDHMQRAAATSAVCARLIATIPARPAPPKSSAPSRPAAPAATSRPRRAAPKSNSAPKASPASKPTPSTPKPA